MGKRDWRPHTHHATADVPFGIALPVPKKTFCNWIGNWGSLCPCSAAHWLMHEEVSCIHTRAGTLVGFVLQAVIWLSPPRLLPFGTWCQRMVGWARPSRSQEAALFAGRLHPPPPPSHCWEAAGQRSSMGRLHGTRGKGTNHAWSFAQTISNFPKCRGQTHFLPVPHSALSVGHPACRMQRHHAAVKIKCW